MNGLTLSTNTARAIATFLLCFAVIFTSAAEPSSSLKDNRSLYQQALNAVKADNTEQVNLLKQQLKGYALYPFIEYESLINNLSGTSNQQVREFLNRYPDLPVSRLLQSQWAYYLQQKGDEKGFLAFYRPGSSGASQDCYYQTARYRTGHQTEALEEALKLWNVGKSQPKSCDKLFAILIERKHITNELAWQRFTKAVLAHQYNLARYLQRFFTDEHYNKLANAFYAIDREHTLRQEHALFKDHPREFLTVIQHGLEHLARRDATNAMLHWRYYQQIYQFDEAARNRIVSALIKGLHKQDKQSVADRYLEDNPTLASGKLIEWRARKALAELNWVELIKWTEILPDTMKEDLRWRYWRSRGQETLAGKMTPAVKKTYQELAGTRSLYGFLASDRLGEKYSMAHRDALPDLFLRQNMENDPHIIRTRELLYHQQFTHARREWRSASRGFSEQQWITAAHITRDWAWHNGTINSMISATFWDDIKLRFPIPHRSTFNKHATETGIPVYLLLALARQESAMSADVTSPAGAKGLMQLMPATASQTARKNGVSYKNSHDLFTPEINITLGSRYYKEMLTRFENNRILATAAYNAGPHRVDRWLKGTQGQLPFDAWIEIIPFPETRGYVQNVLAFSMIYAHHLNIADRMLRTEEMDRLL